MTRASDSFLQARLKALFFGSSRASLESSPASDSAALISLCVRWGVPCRGAQVISSASSFLPAVLSMYSWRATSLLFFDVPAGVALTAPFLICAMSVPLSDGEDAAHRVLL